MLQLERNSNVIISNRTTNDTSGSIRAFVQFVKFVALFVSSFVIFALFVVPFNHSCNS